MNADAQSYGYAGSYPVAVADAAPAARAEFIRRTYAHLAGAVLAFVVLEAVLLSTPLPDLMMQGLAASRFSWLVVLGVFMGMSWLAEKWASDETSMQMQYAGLALFVVAEALIFLPLLFVAAYYSGGLNVIPMAGLITLTLFGGLTATVFVTQKDFSFLGTILTIGGFVAMGVVAASILFGFNLGLIFSGVMVLFAAASILYQTSNVMHRFTPTQHVAAALVLFSAVALLFWYVLRIVMGLSRRD
jgi:FtsH-binding integral membrane protein